MSTPDRTAMLDRALMPVPAPRARSLERLPLAPVADLENLAIMRRLDELYLA